MTGKHPGHAYIRDNRGGFGPQGEGQEPVPPGELTLPLTLKRLGYTIGGFGKWGLGYEGTTGHPNRQGFDEFFGQYLQVHAHFYYPYWVWHNAEKFPLPENEGHRQLRYVADETHRMALDFIRRHKDGPFFAYLPYIIPHVELVVPEESERAFRGKFPKVPILDPRPGYLGSEDGYTTLAGMIARLPSMLRGEVEFQNAFEHKRVNGGYFQGLHAGGHGIFQSFGMHMR